MFATFKKGGVHPKDMKYLSKDSEIEKISMPDELIVSMSQHLGAPAELIKAKGDVVKKGELIGKASSFISANVHSPVNGTVTDIRTVMLATGVVSQACVIKPSEDEKENKKEENIKENDSWKKAEPSDLLEKVKEKGIVGLGGATFPAHVKFTIPQGKKVDALVINGVECEPYLTADYRLMLERPDQVLTGIQIIARILNPVKVFIGIELNKLDAVELLNKKINERNLNIQVVPLKMKYPQGDEKQLLKAVINREIPSGKLPLDVGAVVANIATTWAVYTAVCLDKPLTERIVTVTGDCIAKPSNFLALIGTKVSHLIKCAGGYKTEPDKLISGGPMMGFAFYEEETPITKGSGGILAIKDPVNHTKTACLHCGRCVAACPIGLEPTLLYSLITNGKYKEAMKANLMDCKECGCCSFSCPAHLDLVQAMKTGKRLGKKI